MHDRTAGDQTRPEGNETLSTRDALLTSLVLLAGSGLNAHESLLQPPATCQRPSAPAKVAYVVEGRTLTLTWNAPASSEALSYRVEFGDAPGSTYLGTADTGNGRTSYSKPLDPGVYFVRVRAANACGGSEPSSELRVEIDPAHIGERTRPDVVVAARTAARNTYFPTIASVKNGDLVVVYYDSPDHVAPNGRIAMVRSSDQGRTWSPPSIVVEGPNDERDPSIVETARGTWLVSYFETDVNKLPASQGVFVIRSTDQGRTWSAPAKVGTTLAGPATSAKIVQLDNAELLIPLYGGRGAGDLAATVVRSGDDGVTWPAAGEATLAEAHGRSFVEPALGYLGDGRLLAMIRSEGSERAAFETTSSDGGRTWAAASKTTAVAEASDLLPIADGGKQLLVHTWGDLSGRFGDSRPTVMQVIRFREFPDARWTGEPRLLHQGHCWTDEGYPSSVRLRDGRVFTVYYDACAGYIGGTFSTIEDPAAFAQCDAAPPPVELKLVGAAGGNVSLAWGAVGGAHVSYMLEAGTAPGTANALAVDTGSATTYEQHQVKTGTYYVRVRATNRCGSSAASNEVVVVVQ